MKPNELRARRKEVETARAAQGERLRLYLAGANPLDVVHVELIPTDDDLVVAQREVRRLVAQAKRRVKGSSRDRKLDELVRAMARLVFVKRVLGLDRLQRAGLTPRRLRGMSMIAPSDLYDELADMAGVKGTWT